MIPLLLLACRPLASGGESAASSSGATWDLLIEDVALAGATLPHGSIADVAVSEGRIVAIGALDGTADERVDGRGRWLSPAFIDSHVHLAYLPQGPEMARGGVAVAVDMAAPVSIFAAPAGSPLRGPLLLLAAGPMITADGGYPTQSWGSGGYGLECSDATEAVAAVEDLAQRGARLVKLPLTSGPQLDPDAQRAVVEAAHAHGLPVASHATSDAEARMAAVAGADLLAHMPTEALSEEALAAWSTRAVIPTLHAFGGKAARDNLARLQAAGAQVLYGTDFGNTRTPGIDPQELDEMRQAGMRGADILDSGTRRPALYWGLDSHGVLDTGKAASLLLLAADPHVDPLTLASPLSVWIDGVPP